MLCAEPKEHKRFRPGTRPGGIGFPAGRIGDRGDREIVYVPNVYVPFPPLKGGVSEPPKSPKQVWKECPRPGPQSPKRVHPETARRATSECRCGTQLLSGPIRANRFAVREHALRIDSRFENKAFQKMDGSKEMTRITRISMRIGESTHAHKDWTTGVPDNGNEWRKFCAVPRSYPLRSLVLCFAQ